VPIIILAVSFTSLLILLVVRCHVGKTLLTNKTILIVCCISIPISVVLLFRAGKASLIPTFPGVSVQGWGCCTQGIILPRERVPGLVSELQAQALDLPPDLIVRDYAQSRNMLRFVLDPVQVQHMGKLTSFPGFSALT
jgi:hypothetical protein